MSIEQACHSIASKTLQQTSQRWPLIADEVSAVSLIKDEVSAVADNATDIGIVATDLLGLAICRSPVNSSRHTRSQLGAIVDEMLYAIGLIRVSDDAVSALALLTTQITALGARTTEIDAGSQLDTCGQGKSDGYDRSRGTKPSKAQAKGQVAIDDAHQKQDHETVDENDDLKFDHALA